MWVLLDDLLSVTTREIHSRLLVAGEALRGVARWNSLWSTRGFETIRASRKLRLTTRVQPRDVSEDTSVQERDLGTDGFPRRRGDRSASDTVGPTYVFAGPAGLKSFPFLKSLLFLVYWLPRHVATLNSVGRGSMGLSHPSPKGRNSKDVSHRYCYLNLGCGLREAWRRKPASGFPELAGSVRYGDGCNPNEPEEMT